MRSAATSAFIVAAIAVGVAAFHPAAKARPADAKPADAKPAVTKPAVTKRTPKTEPTKTRHLRVAVAGSEPFVVRDPPAVRGLSIDVWKAVAKWIETSRNVKITFEIKAYKRVADAIKAVQTGAMDVAVGPISITAERAERVDFTQPYYTAAAGILAQSKASSAWKRFKPFLSKVFLFGFIGMLIVLFVVGNLVWLAERRVNAEEFPRDYFHGVLAGMWFAIVTMTTVGYGDKSPKTAGGKAVASVWMLIALLAMSSVTAGIATAFTLSQIQTSGISDMSSLGKRTVVVVDGTPGQNLARRYRANTISVKSKEEALAMVNRGDAEAMIYDYPVLKYYLQEHPKVKLVAIQTTILSDNYGFAARLKSSLIPEMNIALLHLRESGKVREISVRWLNGN